MSGSGFRLKALAFGLTLFPAPSVSAITLRYDGPPWIRVGQDLVDRCETDTMEHAAECAGMLEAIADRTEAARWRDECPPVVETHPPGSPPPSVDRMLVAARAHPGWLRLPVNQFVDLIERENRCRRR